MPSQCFSSFGRCARGESEALRPRCVDEIQQAFAAAMANDRRVTIRGGGHSFDGRARRRATAASKRSYSLTRLNKIKFEPGNRVTVGAGATWCDILAESMKRGLIPAIMQTASRATAGGTLAGDCLSRFSGGLGKESEWIESFCLVPVVGEPFLHRSRQENKDLFHAAIGGHGYLGFVTDITYQLLELPAGSCAHTEVTTFTSLSELVEAQVPSCRSAPRAVQ